MGKITDMKQQARNPKRVSVYVDGEFLCGLEKIAALEHGLRVGEEVDEARLRAATEASENAAAFDKAAAYLGRRPCSVYEMRNYLIGKGFGADTVERTVNKLSEYGYLDDAEYSRMYIESHKARDGVRKMEMGLRARGVARDVIDAALEELDGQSEEIYRVAEKYLSARKCDRRKLTAYLMGRGFDYDTVKDCVSKFDFNSSEEDDD